MSDKCEWKDGKFEVCQDYGNYILKEFDQLGFKNNNYIPDIFSYCPFYGVDVRKLEENTINNSNENEY